MINPRAIELIVKQIAAVSVIIKRRGVFKKPKFAPGTLVRMNARCIREMSAHSRHHIEEFKDCIGHIEGFAGHGTPYEDHSMFDVRWHIYDTGLRYAYPPRYLERLRDQSQAHSQAKDGAVEVVR